ncbi:LysO family transporter [Perlabentimonas gracilis]|uniref:LysO family transporter n=1 Tax=Perlabentimonas gracilis TaxID=2715279 RepID=UPI0014090830|nr:LysO family transporter [Perlabentimonas gracilis]NHB67699.1 lysine exporter LysO family protein [Perlabentimonas gracilis]
MVTVIIIMCLGIVLGYLIRNRKLWVRLADKLTMWAIYLLLFLLGIAIGTNEVIVKNLPTLGLKALLISMGGVMGSVLVAWLAYRLWFAPKDSEHEG